MTEVQRDERGGGREPEGGTARGNCPVGGWRPSRRPSGSCRPSWCVVAGLLFLVTFEIDWAAYHHHLHLPFWIESGSADAARQVLIAIAAAVITVVGVVFSITILALTLASQQFGPRMMRNFVRDVGNQVTLGIFVATFVYSVLALVSITSIPHRPDFVPHLSVTVAEALLLVDLAVLIYFIHHIAKSIQLPEVIAGIARDLMRAIDAEFPVPDADESVPMPTGSEKSVPELLKLLDDRGGTVTADTSGYLQFVGYAQLVDIASRTDAVIRLDHRPGHFVVAGRPLATVWPRGAAEQVGLALAKAHVTGPHRTLMQDPGLRHRPAGGDRHPCPVAGGKRHVHRPYLHRLAVGRAQQAVWPDARGSLLPRRLRPRAAHRVRPVVRTDGQSRLRQGPPGGARDAGRDHPAARRLGGHHGTDHVGRAAPHLAAPGGHDPPGGRGISDRCQRSGGHSGPLPTPARRV